MKTTRCRRFALVFDLSFTGNDHAEPESFNVYREMLHKPHAGHPTGQHSAMESLVGESIQGPDNVCPLSLQTIQHCFVSGSMFSILAHAECHHRSADLPLRVVPAQLWPEVLTLHLPPNSRRGDSPAAWAAAQHFRSRSDEESALQARPCLYRTMMPTTRARG